MNLTDSSDPAVAVKAACPLGVTVDDTVVPTTELPSELRIKMWMLAVASARALYPICVANPRIMISAIRWNLILFPLLFLIFTRE